MDHQPRYLQTPFSINLNEVPVKRGQSITNMKGYAVLIMTAIICVDFSIQNSKYFMVRSKDNGLKNNGDHQNMKTQNANENLKGATRIRRQNGDYLDYITRLYGIRGRQNNFAIQSCKNLHSPHSRVGNHFA